MVCRSCGTLLDDTRAGGGCPRCAFGSALDLGQPAPGPAADRVFAGYELLDELGRGGMGIVWLAREQALDRLVALKVISVPDERLRQRLLREGQAAARLRHPHIVPIHAMGGEGTGTFLAMEFLEGGNLDERLDRQPMAPRAAAEMAAKLADALEAAHAAGVLHRDLKPSNILLDGAGEPCLADFGLAAPLRGAGDLTAAGNIAGTPAYLPPEMLQGADRASVRSDVYGLGAVLYTALTGQPPFRGDSPAAVLAQLPQAEPLSPRALQPSLPRDLETICLKCLEKAPGRRYGSAGALRDDLRRFLRGEPIDARPVGASERAWRWARRHPAIATGATLGTLLLLLLAVGGPLVALQLRQRLREALLARSQALVMTNTDGQRRDALQAAEEAARLGKGADVREAVINALTRFDLEQTREWHARSGTRAALVFDPDHDRYVVQDRPGHLEVRRLSDATLIGGFSGPGPDAYGPAFSPDGRAVVARSTAGDALLWREGREQPVLILHDRQPDTSASDYPLPPAEAISPDGRLVASPLRQGGVALVEIDTGRELRRFETALPANHAAFSPDGRWLAIGRSWLGAAGQGRPFFQIVDAATGRVISRPAAAEYFEAIQWSRDGRRLILASNPIGVFRAADGVRLFTMPAPNVRSAWFGPRSNEIVWTTYFGDGTIWDLASGHGLLTSGLGGQYEAALSRDGLMLAKSSGPEDARLFRLEPSEIVRTVATEGDQASDVTNNGGILEYSPDGIWLATAAPGRIELRSAATGEVAAVTRWGSFGSIDTVRFAPDGRSVVACSDEVGLVRMRLVTEPGGPPRLLAEAPIDREPRFQLQVLSGDGRRALLTASRLGRVKIVSLDGATPAVRWNLEGATRGAFLPGDRRVLVNSVMRIGHAPLCLYDAATGQVARTLSLMRGQHVHASPDGRWLMVGSGIGSTVLLHAADLSPGPALPAEAQGAGHNVAFSRDGERIAMGLGSKILLVRTADGAVLTAMENPERGKGMAELAFSPDGNTVTVLHRSGQLALWDLQRTHRELAARGLDW